MIDIKTYIETYNEKLRTFKKSGLSLAVRIISTISLQREIDNNIFTDSDPNTYIKNIFDRQNSYLDIMSHFIEAIHLNGSETEILSTQKEGDARDDLHIELFNDTWRTLTLSDPLNNYKKWIDVIKGRLKLNNLDRKFFTGKKCIDIGCGTGRFSFCMASLGAKVWGIDPGKNSIEFAKKLAKEMKIKDTNFLVQNAYNLSFKEEYFDFATCNGVLHHLDNPEKALEEIFRVLKPGGKFWLYVEGSGGIYHDVWDIIQKSFVGIPFRDTFEIIKKLNIPDIHLWMDIFYAKYHFISFEENERRLRNMGFNNIQVMKSSELFDIDVNMFRDDKDVKLKFGDGGIRVLATK